MNNLFKRFNTLSLFKKLLLIYIDILIILSCLFLFYVNDSLLKYENNQIDKFINNEMKEIGNNSKKYINKNQLSISKLEIKNASYSDGLSKVIKNNKLSYLPINNDNNNYIYEVNNGNQKILTLTINKKKTIKRLGLLTIPIWEIKKVDSHLENGLYTYNIKALNTDKVYINDQYVSNDYIISQENISGLEEIYKYIDIPYLVNYKIDKLIYQPKIEIKNKDNKNIEYINNKNNVITDKFFYTIDLYENLKNHVNNLIDFIEIAKMWSLYLTDDLKGSRHGFYEMEKYLVKNSSLWNVANKWASNVDINFVSNHTLKNPIFTNIKTTNINIYNQNFFTFDIYLEKNMKVGRDNKIDILNDKFYFIYHENNWKLIKMQAIVKE